MENRVFGERRVWRGGYWYSYAGDLQIGYMSYGNLDSRGGSIGFHPVRTAN